MASCFCRKPHFEFTLFCRCMSFLILRLLPFTVLASGLGVRVPPAFPAYFSVCIASFHLSPLLQHACPASSYVRTPAVFPAPRPRKQPSHTQSNMTGNSVKAAKNENKLAEPEANAASDGPPATKQPGNPNAETQSYLVKLRGFS